MASNADAKVDANGMGEYGKTYGPRGQAAWNNTLAPAEREQLEQYYELTEDLKKIRESNNYAEYLAKQAEYKAIEEADPDTETPRDILTKKERCLEWTSRTIAAFKSVRERTIKDNLTENDVMRVWFGKM